MTSNAFLFIVLALSSVDTVAQDNNQDYHKISLEIEQKIFGTPDPLFEINTVPEQYKNESAIILAQKNSLESDSKKYSFLVRKSARTVYNFMDIFREKVYINDNSALSDYSEMTFTKLQEKNRTMLQNLKNYSFVNIRLVKANGKTQKIDIDESAVNIKDENNSKKTKIAIPGLAVGDILDYYVVKYFEINPYFGNSLPTEATYILADEYPVVNYGIFLHYDKRFAIEYQSINNAPDFRIKKDEEDGNILEFTMHHLEKTKDILWFSLSRQIPIIRIKYFTDKIKRKGMDEIKLGEVQKTQKYGDAIESDMAGDVENIFLMMRSSSTDLGVHKNWAKEVFNKYKKLYPAAEGNADSISSFLYNVFKWGEYLGVYTLKTDFETGYNPFTLLVQVKAALKFAYTLDNEYKIKSDILFVSGRNSVNRDDLFDISDLDVLVRTQGNKQQFYYFGDDLYHENELPGSFHGEMARAYPADFNRGLLKLREGTLVKLPSTTYRDNAEAEKIEIQFDSDNKELLKFHRVQKSSGLLRRDNQLALALYEDLSIPVGTVVENQPDLMEVNKNREKKYRVEANELSALLNKARQSQKEKFEEEIKSSYNTKAKELKSFKITRPASTGRQKEFEFEEDFVMEGWVKKAGNNYIIDAGKFISGQLEIKAAQKNRKMDVYMPFPRSFGYHIELLIPDGYSIEGLEKFNRRVENESGGFTSAATVNGNKLVLDVSKYYVNYFEPVTNWSKISAFVDAAFEFNKEKLLLRKK